MTSTILIADDDMASCLILRKMLTELGFCCDVVHNGVEAVHAACGKQYDMIFMDLYMPVLSGIHAAMAIRFHEFCEIVFADDLNAYKAFELDTGNQEMFSELKNCKCEYTNGAKPTK